MNRVIQAPVCHTLGTPKADKNVRQSKNVFKDVVLIAPGSFDKTEKCMLKVFSVKCILRVPTLVWA